MKSLIKNKYLCIAALFCFNALANTPPNVYPHFTHPLLDAVFYHLPSLVLGKEVTVHNAAIRFTPYLHCSLPVNLATNHPTQEILQQTRAISLYMMDNAKDLALIKEEHFFLQKPKSGGFDEELLWFSIVHQKDKTELGTVTQRKVRLPSL